MTNEQKKKQRERLAKVKPKEWRECIDAMTEEMTKHTLIGGKVVGGKKKNKDVQA